MSEEEQDVLVLASHDLNDSSNIATCGQTTHVLNKFLYTATNSSGTNVPGTYILYIPGFRKIEPKPGLELRNDEVVEEKEAHLKEGKQISTGRFLGINATKRGVKTCPVCSNKIGYRAKQCKHCSPSKIRNPRKSRIQVIKPLVSKQNDSTISTDAEMVDVTTRQQHAVSSETHPNLEEPKVAQNEPCVTSIDEQQGLRGTSLISQVGQSVTDENRQESESVATHETQHEVEGILQEGEEDQGEPVELDKPQGTQYEGGGQMTNEEEKEQQKNVTGIHEVIVSNVTEVSTSGDDAVEKTNEETVVTSENQDIVNQVFISSKLTQSNASVIPAGKFSLQDLICGLLAQNQATSTGDNPREQTDDPNSSTATATIAVQTDSTKQNTTGKTSDERGSVEPSSRSVDASQEKKKIPPENSYDANSVALFLGEMAQRNGKKRKVSSASKTIDNEAKVVALMPGAFHKWNILSGCEGKGAKFRKIQPKDIANVQEEVPDCEEEKEEIGEVKGESQCRIMNGNATRRGVMMCTKCNKMIGCRSKICKYCKNHVTENPPRETSLRVIKQAVQLSLPKEMNIQMFSVRKCKTGPELRCFVQFEDKQDELVNKRKTSFSKYTCDCPLCISAKEESDNVCEHAKICCVSSNVMKAKIPKLDPEKLSEMPFGSDLRDMVQMLHVQCSNKNVPLVQYVSCKTLAVVGDLHADLSNPLDTDTVSFVHVRFDKVKSQGCFQRQVYCSGRSCMGWHFISNDAPASLMKPCSCVHFAVCLWAIASDSALLKQLKEYFDAFVLQAKIANN